MKTSEILNQAADDLERYGWCVNQWWPGPGEPACAEGAMRRACVDADLPLIESYLPAKHTFAEYLGQFGWVWNDAQGRTKEEVVEALRACAVIVAARENANIEVPVA